MELTKLKPRKALNKAFLKVKPNRTAIEGFKANLTQLLDRTNDTESEEFHKNLVIDFLKKTYYDPNHYINTKGRNDLVIHNGEKAKSTVGVILEAKNPTNRTEMVSTEKLNTKAFQELVLYYLRERITHNNLETKHLIITNISEWFIFDATTFETLFAQNKKLVKKFIDFETGRLADSKTDFFYKEIAEPFIAEIKSNIEFAYFNLQDYQKPLRNEDKRDDNKLISLFKLLSPEHLLKLPFSNDSNSLDKRFYSELLHIIGLAETKEGGKKLIERNKPGARQTGSLLENAIIQLDSIDRIGHMDRPGQFGQTQDERLFNVALELVITWINRILFLKLMEAQLVTYHKSDKPARTAGGSYSFLSLDKIKNYDDLNSLFFEVLAKKHEARNADVKDLFEKVPYLNSSLFEPSEIEYDATLFISNLRDDKTIPVLTQTVLKDKKGKKRTGDLNTLEYLFEFLDAYDFSSEGSEEIQEENKSLINASVLGLIFEKINGYKDGSFFTPGFITMYMCRETIRKAVVQKFNETKKWSCKDLSDLYDKIEDRDEANAIVNSLKICDPAVGSGHFLVSALNEIIAVKNDLKILEDRDGKRLKEYQLEVVNDELIVTDEEGELFDYNPGSGESQRVQEALFHEKQTIIESCLFGVDINPNSVKICRLRLWIELLKSAYYKTEREALSPAGGGAEARGGGGQKQPALETLPNIDINIKCGNSLVSRFDMDADLKKALKKSKWSIDGYRTAVNTYRNADSKEQKREMEKLIADIKSDFRSEISFNDKKARRLRKLSGELLNLTTQGQLFEMSKREKTAWNKKVDKLTQDTKKLEAEIEAIRANKIFENAFEWRFEFPEVLNNDGDFVGFDVVIGNPPYIRQEELKELKGYLADHYQTYAGTADLYVYFVERAMAVLKESGAMSYIIPNKWMRAGYGKALRSFLKEIRLTKITDFGDLPVFEEATTYPCIFEAEKAPPSTHFKACEVKALNHPDGRDFSTHYAPFDVLSSELRDEGWSLVPAEVQKLLAKIRSKGVPLGEYVDGKIYRGVLTGLNEAFVIDRATRDQLIAEDPRSAEVIKPFLAGRDIKRYAQPRSDKFLIFTRRGIDIDQYPAILKYLTQYRERLEPKPKDFNGKWPGRKQGTYKWYEIQDAVDYYKEFEKGKIIVPAIVKGASYAYDTESFYGNDKTTIIPTDDLSLLAQLNSKVVDFYFKSIASTKQNGYFEYKPVYLNQLPIADLGTRKDTVVDLVKSILESQQDMSPDEMQRLQDDVDKIIFKVFKLSQDEIKHLFHDD